MGPGTLTGPSPRDFTDRDWQAARTDGEVFWILKTSNQGTAMASFAPLVLNEEEAWQVLRYVRNLRSTVRGLHNCVSANCLSVRGFIFHFSGVCCVLKQRDNRVQNQLLNSFMSLTPSEFAAKWEGSQRTERAASQEHFIDLCKMLGYQTPNEADPVGNWYAFDKGAKKIEGDDGFADVRKRGYLGITSFAIGRIHSGQSPLLSKCEGNKEPQT